MCCLHVYVSYLKLIRAKRIRFGAPELLDDMWIHWKHMFLDVADKMPLPNKDSHWINSVVRNLIINKTRLKKIAIRRNDPEDWSKYKEARNKIITK